MQKNGKQLAKLIGGLTVVGILVLAVFYFLNQKEDTGLYAKDDKLNTEAELILAKDLERSYPANVREVVRLYARISKCFYNEKVTEEEFSRLIIMQRALFDEELLENNPLADFTLALTKEVEAAKETKLKLTYQVQKESSVKKWSADGKKYASIILCFGMRNNTGFLENSYEEFLLREDEKERWKIVGWRMTDPVDILD